MEVKLAYLASKHLLLQDIDWSMHGEEARTEAHNIVVRTCARGEMLDEGFALLEQMQKSKMDVGRATVCHCI